MQFRILTAPVKVIGNKEGWVCGLECVEIWSGEPDASGRRRRIEKKGSNFVMEIDAVIPSIDTSANPLLAQTAPGMQSNLKGYIVVEFEKGVSSGGDTVTGAATVIKAAGASRDAGIAIDKYLADGEWWDSNAPSRPRPLRRRGNTLARRARVLRGLGEALSAPRRARR